MKKRFTLTGFICFILSIFVFIDSVNPNRYKPVLAQDQIVYLSEVMTFEAESEIEARTVCEAKGYTFVNRNVNAGTTKKPVYLGYKTTNNEKDAIYEIKLLAMDRGYEIKDKASMQEEYMKQQTELAETLEAAAFDFVDNFLEESPKAIDAYNGMNLIVVPEEDNQKFGDFLLAGKGTKDFFAKFIVQASSSTLNSVISYLSAGLAPYHKDAEESGNDDTSWGAMVASSALWDIIEDDLTEDEENELYQQYGDLAQGLHKQFQDFASRVECALQRDTNKPITASESVETVIEQTETIDENQLDTLYIDVYEKLNEYDATESMALGDYILNLGKMTSDAVDLKLIYPIVDSMSFAQCRMAIHAGLIGAASNVGKNEHSSEYNSLLETTKAKLKTMTNNDYYSIWLNADPDFETSKVAYTSDAIRKNAAQASLEKDTSNEGHETVERVLKWAGIVSSGLTVLAFILGKYALVGLLTIVAKFATAAVASTLTTVIGGLTTITTALGPIGLVIGLFILVFTAVYYLMRWILNLIKKNKPKEYTDMPDYVVDAPNTKYGTANIKYKAVRNSEGKIADLNGYEGQQGWVCMYYTKDTRVGSPIIADDENNIFNILYGNSSRQNGYDSVNFFGEINPGNCNTFAKQDDVNGIYIHYRTVKSLGNVMAEAPEGYIPVMSGKQYYEDIIVRTGKTEADAKNRITMKGYYLIDQNLTPSPYSGSEPYDDTDKTYYTYIGYTLTSDPSNAIRDIRVATFLPNSTVNFGDIGYGCGGVLGYKANTTEEDKEMPGDLSGLYMTKSEKAGSPIPEGNIHIVSDYSQAKAGWELVTTFSGAPYDFNSVYIPGLVGDGANGIGQPPKMIGVRMDPTSEEEGWSHTKTLIYYEPEVTYTSGTKYLSGMFYIHGYDADNGGWGKFLTTQSAINEIKKYPNVTVVDGNLASSVQTLEAREQSMQKHLYLCYTYSYNPYRALYDAMIYQSSPYVTNLPYTISKASTYSDKKAGAAENSLNYVSASVYSNQLAMQTQGCRGYLSQNAYMNQVFLMASRSSYGLYYTKDLPEGINYGYEKTALLPTGLFVAGYTKDKNPLTLNDVIISSKAYEGKNYEGAITFDVTNERAISGELVNGDFASIQELKNPFSLKAYNIAYPTIYNDSDKKIDATVTKYIYLRKKVTKGKYISRVFVGSFCKEDYTPEDKDHEDDEYEALSKSTDHQAMLMASSAASGEVIMYNLSNTNPYQWFNYNDDGISELEPANEYQYASYISVARSDRVEDAIRGLLLFKSDEKVVPEQIQVQGMAYYCASSSTPLRIVKNDDKGNDPKKNKMEYESYYLYYTYNKGANPGKPLTGISISNDPFVSGQATVLCTDKEDVVAYEGGQKIIKEPANIYGNGDLNAFIHTSYEHGTNTYFNKLYVGEGSTKKEALLSLLEQGCTEFCDMDLNVDAGGKYVYFGYRGFAIDDDKINMLPTESAREAELKNQLLGAVYDIVCTVGEPFHPEGINSERYQLHYAPVSKTNLNAGTQGPEIYMYYTSTLVTNAYNQSIKDDPSKPISNNPADIFGAPVTKIAFARYDRVPFLPSEDIESDGETNIFGWEYIMNIDFKTVTDFNAGVVKFDGNHGANDNRVTAFIQRGDGSIKSWGEITGGFVSNTMTVGSVFVVHNPSTSTNNALTNVNQINIFGNNSYYEDMHLGRVDDYNIYLNSDYRRRGRSLSI